MHIKRLAQEDIEAFLITAETFFNESRYGSLNANRENYTAIVRKSVEHPDVVAILLAYTPDWKQVAGYAILNTFNDYTEEPMGDMYQFYVHPEHRGSMAGRKLAQAVVTMFDAWKCPISHVCADTGIDNGLSVKLFRNLFAKMGYKETGIMMTRTIGG